MLLKLSFVRSNVALTALVYLSVVIDVNGVTVYLLAVSARLAFGLEFAAVEGS